MMAQSIWNAGLLLLSFETYGGDSGVLPGLPVLVTANWELVIQFHRAFVARGSVLSELISHNRLGVYSYELQIVEPARAHGHDLGYHASTPAPDHVYAFSQAPAVPESAQCSCATS